MTPLRGQVRSALLPQRASATQSQDRTELADGLLPRVDGALRRDIETALIVGGGPAGLASAIKLAERGIQVAVLEMRSANYSRPHHLNAREDTIHSLRDLGVYESVRQASGWKEHPVCETRWTPQHGQADLTLAGDSVGQVRISDVERALHEKSRRLGVVFLEGQTARLEPGPDGMYSVVAQPVQGGQAESMGQPDLVVVADGANSPTPQVPGDRIQRRIQWTLLSGGAGGETHRPGLPQGRAAPGERAFSPDGHRSFQVSQHLGLGGGPA